MMKKLLVMGCALLALVSGMFAEEWSAEKTQTTRAALQDGVFTLDIAKPTRYSIIQFRLDGKIDTDKRFAFEYRVADPEKLEYVACVFFGKDRKERFFQFKPSAEWTPGSVELADLLLRSFTPESELTGVRVYGRINDKQPAAPMKIELRNVRFEASPLAERRKAGLVTASAKVQDGVFSRTIDKPVRFCEIRFRQNVPFKPGRKVVFEYRVKDPEKLKYVAVSFSPDGKRWTFSQVKPSAEWTRGEAPFSKFYYTGKMGSPKEGEVFQHLNIYGRIDDKNPAAPMQLELRNIRIEDDAAYNPLDGIRKSYSAYPVFYWAASPGAAGYEITAAGRSVRTSDAFFVPAEPLKPGIVEYAVKALPSGREIAKGRVYIPERNIAWKRPDFDFKPFAALPHPRLKKRLEAGAPDKDVLIANARRDLTNPMPPEPPEFKPNMEPEIRGWIDWKRVYGGRINSVAMRLQRAGKAAMLSGDPELLKLARDSALNVAKWDPQGTSGVFTGIRDNDLAGARLLRGFCWCYDAAYQIMTPEERETVAKIIRVRADQFWRAKHPFRSNPANNHSWDNVDAFVFAALTLAEEPGMEMRVRYGADLFAYLFFPELGFEGENNEGLEYWSFGLSLAVNYVEDMKHTVGLDFYQQPWLRQTARFPMYGMPPFGYPVSFSDNHLQMGQANHTCQGPLDRFFTGGLAANARDGEALWYAGLPRRNGTDAVFPLAVPQSRYYPHIGETFFNTFLPDGRENVAVGFHSGHCFRGHQHADQNSFTINAYGDKLAIDGGYYDWFGSPHFRAYSTQTVAHNTILADGQGQPWGKAGADGATTAFFDAPGFGFVAGDARKAYPGVLKRFDRDLLFVKPDYVFIFDRLAAEKPVKFDWLIHSHTDDPIPYRDGQFTIRRPLAELAGTMLLPAQAVGKCAKSTDVAPVLYYSTSPAPRFEPEWTLAVSPAGKAAATEFLAALQIGRPGMKQIRWKTTETADAVLVTGDGVEVLFNRRPGTLVKLGGFATDARCAAAVLRNGEVADAMKTGGKTFSYRGKVYGAGQENFALKSADMQEKTAQITLDGKPLAAKLHVVEFPLGRAVYAAEGVVEFPADAEIAVTAERNAHLLLAHEKRHWGDELSAGQALTVPVLKGRTLFCISSDGDPGAITLTTVRTRPAAAKAMPENWQLPANAVRVQAEESVCEGRPRLNFQRKPGSSGYVSGYWGAVSGRFGEWHVTVPEAGRYRLYLRYATMADRNIVHCRMDGRAFGAAAGAVLPPTGSPDVLRWAAIPETIKLAAGKHVFRLIAETGVWHFDEFALVRE